jgi:hypothetical protein
VGWPGSGRRRKHLDSLAYLPGTIHQDDTGIEVMEAVRMLKGHDLRDGKPLTRWHIRIEKLERSDFYRFMV